MSTTIEIISRDEAISRIRAALKKRSGKAWSVTGGRGSAYGWLTIDAPPARRTWERVRRDGATGYEPADYVEVDTGKPGSHTGPADRAELGQLLGLGEPVHHQGRSVPASTAHYREYVDRAEGREPSAIAEPYWD